jgi:hypothetical protein
VLIGAAGSSGHRLVPVIQGRRERFAGHLPNPALRASQFSPNRITCMLPRKRIKPCMGRVQLESWSSITQYLDQSLASILGTFEYPGFFYFNILINILSEHRKEPNIKIIRYWYHDIEEYQAFCCQPRGSIVNPSWPAFLFFIFKANQTPTAMRK